MVLLRQIIPLLSVSSVCLGQNSCFYPNGKNATGDFPCDLSAENSACCGGGLGSVCLSNKLCRGPNGNLARGSCTDKNWEAPECALFCLGASTGGHDLISCTNVTRTDTSYCCDGHTAGCCDSGVARFDVLPSNPQVSATWNAKSSRFAVVLTTSSTPTLPTTSGFTDATNTPNPSPNFPDPSPNFPNQSPDPTGLPQTTQGLSTAAQVGIGVGAAVGAMFVAAVVWLLWRRKKNKTVLGAGGTDQTMTSTNWQAEYYKPGGLPPQPQEMYALSSPKEVEGHMWVELPASR